MQLTYSDPGMAIRNDEFCTKCNESCMCKNELFLSRIAFCATLIIPTMNGPLFSWADDLCKKMMNVLLNMMNYVLKTMNSVLKTMNFVLNIMNLVLKMMNLYSKWL